MKTVTRWGALVVVLLLLQLAVLPALGPWAPDLLLLLTIIAAVRHGRGFGQGLGFAAGLLQGLFTTDPLGAHAVLLTAAGFAAGSMRGLFAAGHPAAPGLISIPLTAAAPLLLGGLTLLAGQEPGWHWQLVPLTVLSTCLAGFLPRPR